MKKILLLGGSPQQTIAINTAKRLGLFTVLCDYLPDNPGQCYADKFYLISTTDKTAVLELAKKEGVSGVLAYASDPAAPTAAYVAEQMGLYTNPQKSVDILCNKDLFRGFLKENGFAVPMAEGFDNKYDALNYVKKAELPVIIKPVDSSGSKGATVLHNLKDVEQAIDFSFSFSRSGRIIIEQFVQMKHKYLIGGDIFIIDGKVALWGLMNCHRDETVNKLVPVGKSYPLQMNSYDEARVKYTIQRLVDMLEIKSGAMNVELIIGKNDEVYVIDAGPRNGGNMIPDLMSDIFSTDVVEMTVRCAMGDIPEYIGDENPKCFMATHNLHSDKNGLFGGVEYSDKIKKFIIKDIVYKNVGDKIEYFDNASKAIGIAFMKFESNQQMMDVLENIHKHIKIIEG